MLEGVYELVGDVNSNIDTDLDPGDPNVCSLLRAVRDSLAERTILNIQSSWFHLVCPYLPNTVRHLTVSFDRPLTPESLVAAMSSLARNQLRYLYMHALGSEEDDTFEGVWRLVTSDGSRQLSELRLLRVCARICGPPYPVESDRMVIDCLRAMPHLYSLQVDYLPALTTSQFMDILAEMNTAERWLSAQEDGNTEIYFHCSSLSDVPVTVIDDAASRAAFTQSITKMVRDKFGELRVPAYSVTVHHEYIQLRFEVDGIRFLVEFLDGFGWF